MASDASSIQPDRLLVIRLSSIGDVLLASPVVRMIKKRFPEARIDVAVKKSLAPLWERNPHINGILTLDGSGLRALFRLLGTIRDERYPVVVDLHGHFRTRILSLFSGANVRLRYRADRWARFMLVHFKKNRYRTIRPVPIKYLEALKPIGIHDDGGGLELNLDPAERSAADSLLPGRMSGAGQWIALAPGARWPTKRWPAECYTELGRILAAQGYAVLVLGGAGDRSICEAVASGLTNRIVVCGEPLRMSAALISRVRVLVTNDTGLMHMACAVGTPVVALFGPTTEHFGFFPFRGRSAVSEKPLSCRPCSYHGGERCPQEHFLCMRSIKAEEVFDRVKALLET